MGRVVGSHRASFVVCRVRQPPAGPLNCLFAYYYSFSTFWLRLTMVKSYDRISKQRALSKLLFIAYYRNTYKILQSCGRYQSSCDAEMMLFSPFPLFTHLILIYTYKLNMIKNTLLLSTSKQLQKTFSK